MAVLGVSDLRGIRFGPDNVPYRPEARFLPSLRKISNRNPPIEGDAIAAGLENAVKLGIDRHHCLGIIVIGKRPAQAVAIPDKIRRVRHDQINRFARKLRQHARRVTMDDLIVLHFYISFFQN